MWVTFSFQPYVVHFGSSDIAACCCVTERRPLCVVFVNLDLMSSSLFCSLCARSAAFIGWNGLSLSLSPRPLNSFVTFQDAPSWWSTFSHSLLHLFFHLLQTNQYLHSLAFHRKDYSEMAIKGLASITSPIAKPLKDSGSLGLGSGTQCPVTLQENLRKPPHDQPHFGQKVWWDKVFDKDRKKNWTRAIKEKK